MIENVVFSEDDLLDIQARITQKLNEALNPNLNYQSERRIALCAELFGLFLTPEGKCFLSQEMAAMNRFRRGILVKIAEFAPLDVAHMNMDYMAAADALKALIEEIDLQPSVYIEQCWKNKYIFNKKIELLFTWKATPKTQSNQTSKMSYAAIIDALDVLVEYPDLQTYIKEFNAPRGFMFTFETDPQRIAYEIQLEQLLDANGMHSGGSWGCLMRSLQAVYTGAVTRAEVEKQVAAEKRRIHEYEVAYQLRQAAAAQVRAEYPCEAEAEEAEAEEADQKINCYIINK